MYLLKLFCTFSVCDMKCGVRGCVERTNNLCCHKECLGGCSNLNSARHCYACKHLRMPNGECVEKCHSDLFEVQRFHNIWSFKVLKSVEVFGEWSTEWMFRVDDSNGKIQDLPRCQDPCLKIQDWDLNDLRLKDRKKHS